MQIIRKNFGLKLLALVLAIVGWAYFRFATNPIVAAARFAQQISVPINVVNLPVGYVVHFTEREAVVTVETKRGEPAIKPDDIKALLDLSNKGAGVYNVPIELVAPAIAVQSLSPASVTLSIERIEQRTLPIVVHYVGPQPAGIVVTATRVRPATLVVSGPTSLLSQVTTVHVDVGFPAVAKSLDEMVRPTPVNAFGNEVMGLDLSPELVRAQVVFAAASGTAAHP